MTGEANNTDRELWRGPDKGNGSYYEDSIHVTEGGGIGINVGGHVIVKPLRDWHALAQAELSYAKGVADANEMVGALWSDLFNKDMVNRGADQFFDKWRDRIKALSVPSTMQLCPDWRTCNCKDGCAHSSTERGGGQ